MVVHYAVLFEGRPIRLRESFIHTSVPSDSLNFQDWNPTMIV